MTERTVLVVDADPAAAVALASRLDAAGFEARAAISGSAAFTAAHATHFHTAVVIANLDDSQWQHWIQKLNRAAPHTWILIVTEGEAGQMTDIGHGLGADGVLPTPLDLHALCDRLRALSVRRRPTF
jgi:DNA-binding response OmpR family regulator